MATDARRRVRLLIRGAMASRGVTYRELADRLRVSEVALAQAVRRGGMPAARLVEIMDGLGLELRVVSKEESRS